MGPHSEPPNRDEPEVVITSVGDGSYQVTSGGQTITTGPGGMVDPAQHPEVVVVSSADILAEPGMPLTASLWVERMQQARRSPGHVTAFPALAEADQLAHLIAHGHLLGELRAIDNPRHLDELHWSHHPAGSSDPGDGLAEPADLAVQADKAVAMAGGLREHLHAGDWASAYGAADWLLDLAELIRSQVWGTHPEARPESWGGEPQ